MVEVNVVFVVKQEIVKGKKKGDDYQNTITDLELSSIQEEDNQDITKEILFIHKGKVFLRRIRENIQRKSIKRKL
jgi:hypothetical protein